MTGGPKIIGSTRQMREIFRVLRKVAAIDITVLISGESGTGKELVARTIHQRSPRNSGPFVAVNCGAIPETLVESEFFGHQRGAFTGANDKHIGCFERASGGVLFLDEVGELSLAAQTKILRALQERQITRIGGRRTVDVDVRVVAATNRDLGEAILEGRFREDLYYRLNVINLRVPPLRERLSDLPALVDFLISRYASQFDVPGIPVSESTMEVLRRYHWPGNVRELQNVLFRALALSEGSQIEPQDLPPSVREDSVEGSPSLEGLISDDVTSLTQVKERTVELVEVKLIRSRLERYQFNQTAAAASLGISRKTLFNKMRRYGISASLADGGE